MKNSGFQMIKAAAAAGLTIRVFSEGETLYEGKSHSKAWAHSKAVGEFDIYLLDEGDPVCWARICHEYLVGRAEDTLCDYTAGGWIADWVERTENGQAS